MTIELSGVTKVMRHGRSRHVLFKNLDIRVEPGEKVAVLAVKGSGKSTLLKMMCGAEPADAGSVTRTSSVSWPIPTATYLAQLSSVITNIRFIARLYGVDQEQFIAEVADMAKVRGFLNEKLGRCPRFVRPQLGFALGLWFDFDIYLFDDRVITGGKSYLKTASQIFESRTKGRGLLVATSVPKVAQDHCDTAYVVEHGHSVYYSDMDEAIKHFKSLEKLSAPEEAEEEDEEDEEIGSEFDI